MKKIYFTPLILSALFLLLSTGGCQEERLEIIEPANDQVLTLDNSVVTLMQNTALNDGSRDNILDRSSCTSIILPVTVVVSGRQITINSEEDFGVIEKIFDESDDDDDELTFIFPIVLMLPDYTQVTVNDDDELEDLVEDCNENEDDDIECVDFRYPFSVSVFNTGNQVANVITFQNDRALYEFLDDLEDEDLVGIDFPITMILSDGTEVEADNNDELEVIIENSVDDCDEDDDNDHNDDDADDSELIQILTEGTWFISRFFDEEDETANFNGYIFTFNANGTVSASNGSNQVTGTWDTNGDDGDLELELDFGDQSPFDELEEEWEVIAFDNAVIRLTEEGDDDDGDKFLTFEKQS